MTKPDEIAPFFSIVGCLIYGVDGVEHFGWTFGPF